MQKKKILMALLVSSILTPSVSVFAEEMTEKNLVSESTSIVQFEVAEDDEESLKDEDFIAFWLRYQANGQTKELTAPFRAVKKYFPNYTYSDINDKIFEEEYPDLEYKDLIYYLPHGYDFVSTQSSLKEAT